MRIRFNQNQFCNSKLYNFCQSLGVSDCAAAAGYEGNMFARFGAGPSGAKDTWRCYGELKNTNKSRACLDEYGVKTVENCSDPDPVPNTFCYNERLQEIIKELRAGGCPTILETSTSKQESSTQSVSTTTEEDEVIVCYLT